MQTSHGAQAEYSGANRTLDTPLKHALESALDYAVAAKLLPSRDAVKAHLTNAVGKHPTDAVTEHQLCSRRHSRENALHQGPLESPASSSPRSVEAMEGLDVSCAPDGVPVSFVLRKGSGTGCDEFRTDLGCTVHSLLLHRW